MVATSARGVRAAVFAVALLVGPAAAQPGPGAGVAERLLAVKQAALDAGAPADAGRAALALAKLHVERAERAIGGELLDWGLTVAGEVSAAEQALSWSRDGKPPHDGVVGRNLTFAYEAANDKSVQPYFLYVPNGYEPGVDTPLVVYLHGWIPETSKLLPWLVQPSVDTLCDRYGFLFLQPHGRGNTDFQGPGELDVLTAIDEVCALYSVDRDRIYLAGNSMGGYGAYCIGLHHPDRFAALSAACAQSDYFVWYGLDRPTVPHFKRRMLEVSNPVDLMPNARNLPILIQHGSADPLVPPAHAHIADKKLTELGYDHELHIVQAGRHEIYFEDSFFTRLFDYVRGRTRAHAPPRVTYVTYSLDYADAYWVTVVGIERWGDPARVDAQAEAGRIAVTTDNTTAIELRLDQAPVGDGDVTVIWNGETVSQGPRPEDGIVRATRGEGPGPLRKRPGACGPIRSVLDSPFLCVFGTGPGAGARDPLLAAFSLDWWSFCEGMPWVHRESVAGWAPEWAVSDQWVQDADIATRNLVLFGRPEQNQVLARMAADLPIKFVDGGYEIAGRPYVGDNLGLWFCYPNPLAPGRMVLSISGRQWGDGFVLVSRADHKYDLMPDFILFDDQHDPDDTNRYLAAGFFDSTWRFGDVDTRDAPAGER